jgi:hypothetical protein
MPESQNKYLTYQNIVILSDMSDRITNKDFPQKDLLEIHQIVEYFKNECVKPGEKIGDKSSIYFSAFSDKKYTSVDVDNIKELGDKQMFINSTGKYENCGLVKKIEEFENGIKHKYATINNPGLDLISILLDKISNSNFIKHDAIVTDGIDTTFIHYDNHIYIFTDGYLEYSLAIKNNQFRFGPSKINAVRTYCENSNTTIENAIKNNSGLGLYSAKSVKNEIVNLHIVETIERDFNVSTQTYMNPKGLRDNEILEAVWRKWSEESGFKSFEWKKY